MNRNKLFKKLDKLENEIFEYEIKIDDNFNYYLFINNKFVKKYKYKNALYNFVKINYNVHLIF